MEIARSGTGKVQTLEVDGKLDAYWADALSNELETCVRSGALDITLNLANVSFISSAGLRVLIVYLKQMRAINGVLRITDPSEKVRDIFDLSGLNELLMNSGSDTLAVSENGPHSTQEDELGSYSTYELGDVSPGELSYYPPPPRAGKGEHKFPVIKFPSNRFGFGIGAFGDVDSGVRKQFGEFLSMAGITICVPTDQRAHPDYMIEDGVFVPSISMYSGITAAAEFERELHFEAADHVRGLPLSRIAELALGDEGEAVAVLIIAEASALIGSTLKRSPAEFSFSYTVPDIRQQFSFTTEPSYQRSIAVISAVFARDRAPYLRPLLPSGDVFGHAHAAVFTYRPMSAGNIDAPSLIRTLFDEERILAVLHLLYDDRNTLSSVESEFVRGVAFVHPLRDLNVLGTTDVAAQGGGQ